MHKKYLQIGSNALENLVLGKFFRKCNLYSEIKTDVTYICHIVVANGSHS